LIHFTCALTDAPPLLANPLVELLTSDRCSYLRGPFFTGGAFHTRCHHAEDIAFNRVPHFPSSHRFAVDIPAALDARASDRLFGPRFNLGEVRALVEYHHVVDIRDFRHVHRLVDDGDVLARRHKIGSKP
jgi:hypothetical protein